MEQNNLQENNLEKPRKSIFWIIAHIWLHTILYLTILGIIWGIISWLLSGFLTENILGILNLLIMALALIWAVRIGVKVVLTGTIIAKENIIKISVGLIAVLMIIQVVTTIAYDLFSLSQIGQFIFVDVLLFSSSYYWLKKFIS
jgi:hypothetical protein